MTPMADLRGFSRKISLFSVLSMILCITLINPPILSALESPSKVRFNAGGPVKGMPGETIQVKVTAVIDTGWHINTNNPNVRGLIPTEVSLGNFDTASLVSVTYPPHKTYSFEFSERDLQVFSGRAQFDLTLKIDRSVPSGTYSIPIQLQYQACSDRKCLPPNKTVTTVQLKVRNKNVASEEKGIIDQLIGFTTVGSGLGGEVSDYGSIVGLLAVFVLGLSLNLTPCVYPMIPITVGYFGGREENDLARRIFDATLYVLGMALIYSILGALAGVTGSVLGSALQSPIVLAGLAILMVFLSGGMFGFYPLQVPSTIRRGGRNVADMLGTFGMGMTLGVAAAPCMAPATAALLTYVGKIGDFWTGAGIFFVMALGLGTPYIFLAVFTSSLSELPGSGTWMKWIKKALGFVILGVALYFIWPILPEVYFPYLVIFWMVTSAVTLILIHPPEKDRRFIIRAVGVAVVLFLGLYWTKSSLLRAQDPQFKWIKGKKVITKEKQSLNGPTLVYVSADWCVPCKEMEIKTFPNKRLQRKLSRIRTVKIDLSQEPSKPVDKWMMRHDIMGVPTMVFLDHNGREMESLRVQGFISASDLIKRVNRLLDAGSVRS